MRDKEAYRERKKTE